LSLLGIADVGNFESFSVTGTSFFEVCQAEVSSE